MSYTGTNAANLAQKNARNAMQRVEAIEQVIPNIIGSVNESLGKLQQQVSSVAEVLEAVMTVLVPVVGDGTISAQISANRKANDAKKTVAEQEAIAKAIEEGKLVATDTITEQTLMVFEETDKNAKVLEVGSRVQFSFAQLLPEFREKVLGKKIGETVAVPEGHTFTLKEVYTIIPQAAEAAPTAKA